MPGVVRYLSPNGISPYGDFRRSIASELRLKKEAEMDALVLKLGEVGSSALAASRKATKLNDVWELRPKPYRILYFFDKDAQHYVLLQGFRKTSRETPPGEIRQAERMRRAY